MGFSLSRLRLFLKQKTNALLVGQNKLDSLERLCWIIFFLVLGKNSFGYLQAYFMIYVEEGVIMDLRNDLYARLHGLSLSFFHSRRTGHLISRITNDVNLINGTIAATFHTMIREPLLVLFHLVIVIILSWKLTLMAFLLLPISLLVIANIGKTLRRGSTVSQERMAEVTSVVQETISGIRVVKAFGMEGFETSKFITRTRDYFQTLLRLTRIRNLAGPVTEILGAVVGIGILWYGGKSVLEGQLLGPEDFLTFILALFSLMRPLKELGQVNNRIQEGLAAAERVFQIIDTPPEIADHPKAVDLSQLKEGICFQGVGFRYPDGTRALRHIDLQVKAGEVVALVGPSGAGKSTLVDLVARFYDPSEGVITFDGVDLRRIRIASLRGMIGIVTQEVILFNDTIWHNIAYGLEGITHDQLVAAAKAANAHGFISQLSNGYQTIIGDRGVKLSGGQRQRIAIARAILKDPPVLIFDEATSALDNESELLVQEAIVHLLHNRTTFLIAHRLSTIRHADRIIVMEAGRIVQVGSHQSLFEQEGLYRRLYQLGKPVSE